MSMTSICILMYRCPEMSTCIKMAFRYVSKVRCLTWHVAWVTWPICILEIFRLDSPESRFLGSKISSSLPCGMSSLFTSLRSMLEGLEYLYKMSCCLNDCDEFSRLTPAKPKVIFPTQNTTQSQSNMWQTAPPQSEKISYSYCPLIQIEKFCSSCRMKLTGFAIEMFANETLIQILILMKKNERLENERQVEAFANFSSLWWVWINHGRKSGTCRCNLTNLYAMHINNNSSVL